MKINTALAHISKGLHLYQCPICASPLAVRETSLTCSNNHCFDVSSKGYVHFVPQLGRRTTQYSKELFVARQQIFADHFYDGVSEAIIRSLKTYGAPGTVADVGCGEGFYAIQCHHALPEAQIFGLDLSKEAILLAAGKCHNIHWSVADLQALPFADKSMDAVCNILTPAGYNEFQRVLKPDGILIKVIPDTDYLQEIRAGFAHQLQHSSYQNEHVITHLEKHFTILHQEEIRYCQPLTKLQTRNFLQMTPMTFHTDVNSFDLSKLTHISIHMRVVVGKVLAKM